MPTMAGSIPITLSALPIIMIPNGSVSAACASSTMTSSCPAWGVQHREFNPSKDEAVHLLQIWIQPDLKSVKPGYAEKSFKNAAPGALNLVTSKTGRDDSIAIHQDADLWLGRLDAGNRVSHRLAAGRHAWLHIAEGEVSLNGKKLEAGDAAAVSAETLDLTGEKSAQVLLFDLN